MLEWNVYFGDFSSKKVVIKNVFQLSSVFLADCQKNYKTNKHDKEAFIAQLKKDSMYSYWGRCEYEVLIECWPPSLSGELRRLKASVSDQLDLNWDAFSEYVWENREELKVSKRKKA